MYRLRRVTDYALKVIPKTKDKAAEAARREYEIAGKLADCEHVIHYLDHKETEDASYLIQEIAAPWLSYVEINGCTVGDALYAVIQVCDALSAMQEQELLHMDVNPKNLFVRKGMVKLGDFSHSLPCRIGQPHTQHIGTYPFMAPEIVYGGACSGREDIYSLGITMYLLLTGGRFPFSFKGRDPKVRRREDRIMTIYMDQELKRIVEKAAAFDPEDRYISPAAMADDIAAFMSAHLEVLSEPVPRAESSAYRTVFEGDTDRWDHYSTEKTMGTIPPGGDISTAFPKTDHGYTARSPWDDPSGSSFDDLWDDAFPEDDIPEDDIPEDYRSTALTESSTTSESVSSGPASSASFRMPNRKDVSVPRRNDAAISENNVPQPAAPAPRMDEVQFTAVAESSVEKEDFGIVEIAMFTAEHEEAVLNKIRQEFARSTREVSSHGMQVATDTEVTIRLSAKGAEVEDDEVTHRWNGKYLVFSFDYYVPEDLRQKRILFRAEIYINGFSAATLRFTVDVVQGAEPVRPQISREDVRSAFLSYAREDMHAVTYILQALRKARPDMDIFFDLEKLRSGENWEERLYQEIRKRDRLYLCWSHYAALSEWVQREWQCMAEAKGVEAIEPIPLEDADDCPAPEPLQRLHFNDIETLIRKAMK